MHISALKTHIYADGACVASLLELNRNPLIRGLTTNPTLMRSAGITDYERFARQVLEEVVEKPISFEVLSDEFPEMRRQALKIASWQRNVYVKIPVTNTRRESSAPLAGELAREGVKVNVTAILTLDQVRTIGEALDPRVPAIASIFAGRIADTGRDPVPVLCEARRILQDLPQTRVLWASVREAFNIAQANACGCDIVTVPHSILEKALRMWSMELDALSLDTVKMFVADAAKAGYHL